MSVLLVLHDDLLLHKLGFLLILECEQNKTEASPSLGLFVTHHDRVVDTAVY